MKKNKTENYEISCHILVILCVIYIKDLFGEANKKFAKVGIEVIICNKARI